MAIVTPGMYEGPDYLRYRVIGVAQDHRSINRLVVFHPCDAPHDWHVMYEHDFTLSDAQGRSRYRRVGD